MAKLTAVLLLIITVTALTSCSLITINLPKTETSPETADETVTAEPTEASNTEDTDVTAEYLSSLPERKYDGSDFIIASSVAKNMIFDDGNTVISSAVAKRNKTVAGCFDVKISEITASPDLMYAELSSSALSGTYYADLVLFTADRFGSYFVGNMMTNLRSVPFFDVNADYFNASSVKATTIDGKTYAIAGEATLNRAELSCLYYSKYRIEKLGYGNLYDKVRNGEWTLDFFLGIITELYSYNADRIELGYPVVSSFSSEPYNSVGDIVLASSALTYLDNDNGSFAPSELLQKGSELLDKAKALVYCGYQFDDGGAEVKFSDGTLVFMFDKLSKASVFATSAYDWGILPVPTASGEIGTYCPASKTALFAVPKKTVDSEKSGVILSALNAASFGVLDEAYIQNHLDYYLRDNDSANMISVILSNPIYDTASMLANAIPAVKSATLSLYDSYTLGYFISDDDWQSRIISLRNALDEINGER